MASVPLCHGTGTTISNVHLAHRENAGSRGVTTLSQGHTAYPNRAGWAARPPAPHPGLPAQPLPYPARHT